MSIRELREAVGLAMMKAGAWLHRSKGFNYHKSAEEWRFLAASDPVRVLRDAEPEPRAAILRALEEEGRE